MIPLARTVACIVVAAQAAFGQAATLIPDEVSCAKCSIATQQVARLQPGDGPAVIDRIPFAVRVDGRGRYWVTSERQLPMVFGPDGRFVKQVGRMGRGPGEFEWPFDVLPVSGDSIVVFDPAARRAILIGPDLTPGRTIRLFAPIRTPALLRWPDAVVMSGSIYSDVGKDYPLHRVSFAREEANVTTSFGIETFNVSQFEMSRMFQHVAPSKSGGVWSSEHARYRFASWKADGTLLRMFERKPPWFAEESSEFTPRSPPPTAVAAIHEDETGLLWVFIKTAADTWRDGWPATGARQREVAMKDVQYDKLYRTIVEVIDPAARRVVARHSMKEFVMFALPGRRAAVYGSSADGEPFISIISLSLVGR